EELACLGRVADRFEGTDLVVAYGEIALPTGVSGVALGQRLGEHQSAAIAIERLLEPALCDQRIAHSIMAGGEVPLPLDVVGVALAERSGDRQALAEARKCTLVIALPIEQIPDTVKAHGQIVLPHGVLGVLLG